MKIAIVGLTDKLRDMILAECETRGIEVLPEKDAQKLTAEDVRALCAVVDATDPAQLADKAAWEADTAHLSGLL